MKALNTATAGVYIQHVFQCGISLYFKNMRMTANEHFGRIDIQMRCDFGIVPAGFACNVGNPDGDALGGKLVVFGKYSSKILSIHIAPAGSNRFTQFFNLLQ